jgi:anaerobic selenocysteine-containing dehydrogenase
VISTLVGREVGLPGSRLEGRSAEELLAALGDRRGPERVLDFMLRAGPFGDGFGADPDGLTLARLEAAPHGLDLGPMRPRLPAVLRTASGTIELAPEPIVADVARLRAELETGIAPANGAMTLIGRRQLRSNNSWMHNLPALVKGKDRCTALVNPADARRLGLTDGGLARISSQAGELTAPVEVTDEIMAGVISIPHGWGHDVEGIRLGVAAEHPGVNSNLLAPIETDVPSGNAVLNGIPVKVSAADRELMVA